jgi:FKBP-type peptidyl-prolyl cis-trans isomerase FklB
MLMKTRRVRNPSLMLVLLAATTAYGAPTVSPGAVASALPASTGAQAPVLPAALPNPPVSPQVGGYDIGLMLGTQLEHNGVVGIVSTDDVIRGLKDAVGGRAMSADERDAALRFMHDTRDSLAEKNRSAGRAFLERNGKKAGVKSMPSGLQYRVIAAGNSDGASPGPTDDVTVRYRASLIDGTELDRSDTHERPATFRVNSVFKGWQEAFLGMKTGAKWELFVPPELGYGSNPPPSVPPGALLIYEIELLRIDPAAPMDPSAGRRHPAGNAPAAAPPH